MNTPMNLINLKMAIAVAAVLTMVTCLIPTAAQAQRRGSGSSNLRYLTFDLNTSVQDTTITNNGDRNPNVGVYPGAIQNFNLYPDQDPVGDLPILSLRSGDLTVSRIVVPSDPDSPLPGFDFGPPGYQQGDDISFNDLKNDQDVSQVPTDDFSKGVLQYEVTFDEDPIKLTLFLPFEPTPDSDLINSLTGVSQFDQIQAVLTNSPLNNGETVLTDKFGLSSGAAPLPVAAVPETDTTAGLLALGGLGAIALLKRNRRSSRH